jgi:hypothetical protein
MNKSTLTHDEATAFVIRELGAHRKRNDIVMALCERMGMSWQQAEKFVSQVEHSNRKAITAGQTPLYLIISVVLILLGVGGIMYGVQYVMSLGSILQGDIVSQLFSLRTGYVAIGSLFGGLASAGGGIYGFIQAAIKWMREE